MRRHLLTLAVIVAGATGCDNVAFDGVDVAVRAPEPKVDSATVEAPEESTGPVNVEGPILLAGLRAGARASLTLVGEVHDDEILPFPDPRFSADSARLQEITAPGREWILFSEGARVGRLFADAAGTADGYCGSPATISGFVELVPGAAGAERLMALSTDVAGDRPYSEYGLLQDVYAQRVATLQLAQDAIPVYGATWPPQGVLDARKHIQAFDLGDGGPYVAATFVYRDTLAMSPPGQGAYSLFVIGEQVSDEHRGVMTWYRSVDNEGKGIPRYFDHLDWDGDGEDEILVDVLGANRRWFAGVAPREGEWIRTFQDLCGSGAPG